ncbi:RNA polymerase sigma factor [Paenibacillus sacheonensis]|uniref:Sigma-70 family RNA polymerase sigma factor n=1 Tax=Paenibacillus sacheonensis TaxID=742054 RepID=A0A7X4YPE2_9BACL|nr:RNA polymerase sigma factor [Paenibacillus sacheonensis]MBM7565117.1 RNA polymerase sigma-70 factor (ECF subfamily) [Paenibacillus sacheonensis]NBC70100.1 sigma-70 family RNA polymerase sigma factor [Paenibacillus sacheonensis]
MEPWTEFEENVKPHLKHVQAYCAYLTSSKWEAEDLLQEALLRAFKYYRDTGKLLHPRSLLYKIARNLQIDAHRKRRGVTVALEEALLQPHYDPDYVSVRGMLEWLAEHLSERETEMLLLAEVFDYTYQDIADVLHCSVPAVKMVLHRSKNALRKRGRPQDNNGGAPRGKMTRRVSAPAPYAIERWTTALMTGER